MRIQKEESVSIGYHSPGWKAVGLGTLWRTLSADRERGCRPANDPPLTEGMLIVGGEGGGWGSHSQISATAFAMADS